MNRKFLIVLFFGVLVSCQNKSSDNDIADTPGKRLFYSLLKPVGTETKDTVYEGYYSVFENRQSKQRKIDIYIVVIPAIKKDSLLSPVFYLQGGPGDAATGMMSYFLSRRMYRQNRDIVLVDVRGTGKSNPLHCDETQVKTTVQSCIDEMFSVDSVSKCFKKLSETADLSQYTTEISIDDVEEIRQWLGYDAINVYGISYGTRACQSYMRQYPNFIRSAVMIGPAPTFMAMPLNHAYDAQRVWDILLQDCKNDSACNKKYPLLSDEFTSLVERLRKKPDDFTYYDSTKKVSEKVIIRHGPLADLIRSTMYSVKGQTEAPYLIHEAYKGNYSPLIKIAVERNGEPYGFADGFYLCITCSEDVPYISSDKIGELTSNTYMGAYRIERQVAACSAWRRNAIGKNFLMPVESDIPAIVISGGHDPITPPRWGDSVIQKMNKAYHLIIPQMAHGARGLSNDSCFHNLVSRFIDSPMKKIDEKCISSMKPPAFR